METRELEELYRRGIENGVLGLALLTGDEARTLEPNLSETVVAALHAPSAAICSPWEYCLALAETAVKHGVELRLKPSTTWLRLPPLPPPPPGGSITCWTRARARGWAG